jgi:hypothetical protein
MKWFLSETDRQFFASRAASSAVAEPAREGHVALYNKNDWTTWHVPAEKCQTYHGWILVTDGVVPAYWRNVLQPPPESK